MSYLRFDRTLMINLEESLPREVLRTNKSGAYHCTTIVDCNTRKYHGLLVVPIPELGDENHVLLSSLDETIVQHGAEFNLGIHEYSGGVFSPNGHKYIRELDIEKIPATIYRVGGVILKKEKIFVHHENRILIRYTLVNAHSKTTLRLRPFLAFRKVTSLTHENDDLNKEYHEVNNGVMMNLYPGYPDLFLQMNKSNTFHYSPDWYRGVEYRRERERGSEYQEDLFVPGYCELSLEKGESVVFSAGLSEIDPTTLLELFQEEIEDRTPRDSFKHCLKNAAHQFYNKQGDRSYFIAGYPWYSRQRARDLFISLPGLSLSIDQPDKFTEIMATALEKVHSFIETKELSDTLSDLADADSFLWAIWAIQQYTKQTSIEASRKLYGESVLAILTYIKEHKHPNLYLHRSGLLYTDGKEKAVTWMNAVGNDGRPINPRSGYVVEVNALWYNALKFAEELFTVDGKSELPSSLLGIIPLLDDSFIRTFLNDYGYLYDYVDGNYWDLSVRPNMIFSVAFDYSPLSRTQMKSILDIVTKELLVPKGLRSLSPKSMGYNPIFQGALNERNYAYHQGTAWPWLMGFYAEAYLKLHKRSGVSFIERQLIGFESDMTNNCIGSLSELYDGNPPFKGRGAISFAMNTAEILRVLQMLSNFYLE